MILYMYVCMYIYIYIYTLLVQIELDIRELLIKRKKRAASSCAGAYERQLKRNELVKRARIPKQ